MEEAEGFEIDDSQESKILTRPDVFTEVSSFCRLGGFLSGVCLPKCF